MMIITGEQVKASKNIAFSFLSIVLIFLIFSLMNSPPYQAVSYFKLIDSPIGAISVSKFLILFSFVLLLLSMIVTNSKYYIALNDCLVYLITCMILINITIISKAAFLIFTIVIPYFIGRMVVNLQLEHIIFKSLKVAGVLQSILVVYSTFFNPVIIPLQNEMLFREFGSGLDGSVFSVRASGTIGHPVVLAAVLLPSFICWIYELFKSVNGSNTKSTLINLIFSAVLSYSIFLTYSRGTWISAMIVVILLLFKFRILKKLGTIILILIMLVLLATSPITSDIINRLLLINSNDGSFSHRLYMFKWTWEEVIRSVSSFLFGYGSGGSSDRLIINPPPDGFLAIDNAYLTFLHEFGLVGLLIIFIILFRSIFHSESSHSWIVFVILGQVFNGFTFDVSYWEQAGALMWLVIGLSSVNFNRRKQNLNQDLKVAR
ncbi:O-antigen ligase family protein [Paenibacillus sp. 453mf]|uniref:O-antigen ligase family protein n=1 Tax=Paenibacillus sp. 453mf TaxID=1761874 RepID=UPI0008F0BA66|nr:O-antigen ligase family protein [Paenibacillus sp. 453mf]SFS38919.1 O-antigen ligase like membrane protein [Paenibacillus sp. 453mf]